MKKRIEQFFLYRHRLVIGYFLIAVVFISLLCFLPSLAPGGISRAEMESTIASSELNGHFLEEGNIIDLPYRVLQKASIHFFGLNMYSIKLPSIIIAAFTGLFIVLLLNRWFKNDVAIVGSMLTTLSTAFLFLASSGTPIIMYIFWLALILWLGSKIVGNDHTKPLLVVSFFICIALSAYTPHLLYVSFAIAIAGIIHPHLRFALKQIRLWQLLLCIGIFILTITPLAIGCFVKTENLQTLLFMKDFSIGTYATNISHAFLPFFSFSQAYDSVYLAPLFGLASVSLIVIGALASIGKMFTSRNTVVSLLAIYSIFIAGFNTNAAIAIIIPITILSAAGIESIVGKWYSLFPENPYAHLFGFIGIASLIGLIVGSGLNHYVYGYRYAPRVASNFSNDLSIIDQEIDKSTTIYINNETTNKDFYILLSKYNGYKVVQDVPKDTKIATFNPIEIKEYSLQRIITSPKSRNSDRLYIYSLVTE